MDALRCPPPDTLVKNLSRRRKTPRRSVPSAAAKARHSACSTSRRTTSTPRASRWLEQHLQKYEGTIIAVTHDRYFLDNIAGWILELDRGQGIPYKGNYSSWLEQKSVRLAQEQRKRTSCKRRSNASSNGSACRQRAATPNQRPASTTTKRWSRPSPKSTPTTSRSTFRPARGSATSSSRPTAFQRLRRHGAF